MVTLYTSSDEIWHVRVDLRSTLMCHIWSSSVNGAEYKLENLVKIVVFCSFESRKGDSIYQSS